MSDVMWADFPPGWFQWFEKQTGNPFVRAHVNSRCAAIANLLRKFQKRGTNQYGFYYGEVNHPYWRDKTLIRHGWLTFNRTIIDPTRWCFLEPDNIKLAICSGDSPDYDQGMNRAKTCLRPHFPMPDYDHAQTVACDEPDIVMLFRGLVCIQRIFWLANRAPGDTCFKSEAQRKRMFRWLQRNGHRAAIPRDNRV